MATAAPTAGRETEAGGNKARLVVEWHDQQGSEREWVNIPLCSTGTGMLLPPVVVEARPRHP